MSGPTVPTASKRYFQPEISKVYFLPAVAAPTTVGPTRTEIAAGQDITNEIADIAGFNVTSGTIDVPDMGHRFTSKIGGRTTTDDSSLTVYASVDGEDLRTILPRGTTGFLVFADGGDVAAQPADLFTVEVTALGKVRSTGDNGFQLTIGFAITAEPLEDFTLPAAA